MRKGNARLLTGCGRAMIIDHIGVVVRSLEEGLRQWEQLFGYRRSSDVVENARQQVRVVFLTKPQSVTVKLVEPCGEASPVSAFARRGGGFHHVCFRCPDLNSEIAALKSKGVRFTVSPEPGEAFRNHDIAFFHAGGNLIVELIDTVEKAGWADPACPPAL
jgi:methylmalonyl-CoA/ethylmalonyl-CoA epimerase